LDINPTVHDNTHKETVTLIKGRIVISFTPYTTNSVPLHYYALQ